MSERDAFELNMVFQGDSREVLKSFQSNFVDCCVTSPPYYALRDYGDDRQIGLESTPEEYINSLVQVFREVKRVLKEDGTLWVNIGDTYNGCKNGNTEVVKHKVVAESSNFVKRKWSGAKNKDLIGIPWMLAFALRNDGWYLRQDIIWHKPNPMTESVMDRCTKSHEYIFLLSKNSRYYFDHDAMLEDANSDGKRNKRDVWIVPVKPVREAHFATFPEELIKPCILAGCKNGGGGS